MELDDIERGGFAQERVIPAEVEFLDEKLMVAWEILKPIEAALCFGEGDNEVSDEERAVKLQETLAQLKEQISSFVYGDLDMRGEGRVEVVVVMPEQGKYFPAGVHRRFGRILKSGVSDYGTLVQLDEPIGEETVIELPAICLRQLR